MAIKNEFKDCVPSDNSFQVGYFLGKNSSKHWLVSPEDLRSMYSSLGSKRDICCGVIEQNHTNMIVLTLEVNDHQLSITL